MARSVGLARLCRTIATVTAVLTLLVTTTAVLRINGMFPTPNGAHAAPCWDTGCNGVDPQSSGCSSLNESTVDSVWRDNPGNLPATWVSDLRYSGDCGANWGRALSSNCGGDPCHSEVYVNNYYTAHYGGAWGDGTHWTPMLSGYSSMDIACGYQDGQDDSDRDGDDAAICTGWH